MNPSKDFGTEDPLFAFQAESGTYAVGVKSVDQLDRSRAFGYATDALGQPRPAGLTRPMQILLWYPAESVPGEKMTVGDYGKVSGNDAQAAGPAKPTRVAELLDSMSPCLEHRTWAVRDAPPAVGRFPLVIFAPSFSAPAWENADLCEYLASHGYIVLASNSLGARTQAMTMDLEGVNAQAGDIAYLIGYAHTISNADHTAIAAMGFSWGGLSALVASARDHRIRALVALDGSMRYFPGLVAQAGVKPEEMRIPLLYCKQRAYAIEAHAQTASDPRMQGENVLNAWTSGDLLTVHMLGLSHEEFSSMEQRSEEMWRRTFEVYASFKGDYGREDGMIGYRWMACYVQNFLDAYLKDDPAARSFLKGTPAENGVPKHVLSIDYRPATDVGAFFEGFRERLGRVGFAQAETVYEAIATVKPHFMLEEAALDAWAEELIDEARLPEATALLKLNVRLHPASGNAQAALGRVYEKAGEPKLALEAYRRARAIEPLNALAALKLSDLMG